MRINSNWIMKSVNWQRYRYFTKSYLWKGICHHNVWEYREANVVRRQGSTTKGLVFLACTYGHTHVWFRTGNPQSYISVALTHYLCHHDWCRWNSLVHYHCPGMKCLAEKRKWLFWLQSCYTGCRQAEETIVTSGSLGMIAWLGNTTEVQFK